MLLEVLRPSSFSIITSSLKCSRLGDHIDREGVEMFPCLNCEKHNRSCVLLKGLKTKCCRECVCRGVKCDVEGIPVSDWDSLDHEEARLKRERDLVAAEVLAAHQAAIAGMARLQHLEKQQE